MKTLKQVLESYGLTKDLLSDERFEKFVDVLQWWIVNEYSGEVDNYLEWKYQKINDDNNKNNTNMKTFEELKNEVMTEAQNRPSYIRLGQFVFNYIDSIYGVARQVQFDDKVDCYYLDKNIDEFLICALKRINEKKTKHRIGNIEVRPITGTELTYEILKWKPNKFYGKESEYNWSGNIAYTVDAPRVTIDSSCFENEETAVVIGCLKFLENSPNINEICTRVIDLTDEELLDYKKVLRQSIQTYMATGKL